jgi:hypothetical protein
MIFLLVRFELGCFNISVASLLCLSIVFRRSLFQLLCLELGLALFLG